MEFKCSVHTCRSNVCCRMLDHMWLHQEMLQPRINLVSAYTSCITMLLFSVARQYIKLSVSPVVLFEPSGSKFFCFLWSCDWNNVHMHVASSQMAHLWLSVEIVSGCTVLFRSRVINCSQEETFGNLLSRLEGQVLREWLFLFYWPPRSTLWLS